MTKGLLITCPTYDEATAYLTYFSTTIVKKAEEKSFKVKKVADKELNLKSFSKILNKIDYKLVVLNGHGSSESIFGFKDNMIIRAGVNHELLKERIVYARSCNAGLVLGAKCMDKTKNGSFIGYNLPFIFYMDTRWTAKPHNDKVAGWFLEPSNLVPISLIKGHTSLEAHNIAKNQMLRNISRLLKNEQLETPFYVEALWNNFAGQIIFGNTTAEI